MVKEKIAVPFAYWNLHKSAVLSTSLWWGLEEMKKKMAILEKDYVPPNF